MDFPRKCSFWVMTLLIVLGTGTIVGEVLAEATVSSSKLVDVGDNGVCVYGHWLSNLVEVRQEGCQVFINNFRSFPAVSEDMEGKPYEDIIDCSDHLVSLASTEYSRTLGVLENGGQYIVTSSVVKMFGKGTRETARVKNAILAAKASEVPLGKSNWDLDVFLSPMAEQIRKPLPLECCRRN